MPDYKERYIYLMRETEKAARGSPRAAFFS